MIVSICCEKWKHLLCMHECSFKIILFFSCNEENANLGRKSFFFLIMMLHCAFSQHTFGPFLSEWRICMTRRHYLLSVLCRAWRERERERTKEIEEGGSKRARERGRERDTTQLCRWSLRVRNAQSRLPLYHLQSLKNYQHFCCHFAPFKYWRLDRNSRPGKISIFNVKVKEHRWFWRWRNEPPVTLKGKFTLSYFVSCFRSRDESLKRGLFLVAYAKMCWHLPF